MDNAVAQRAGFVGKVAFRRNGRTILLTPAQRHDTTQELASVVRLAGNTRMPLRASKSLRKLGVAVPLPFYAVWLHYVWIQGGGMSFELPSMVIT